MGILDEKVALITGTGGVWVALRRQTFAREAQRLSGATSGYATMRTGRTRRFGRR